MLVNTQENLPQLEKQALEWLPKELNSVYQSTDLDYGFCLKLFAQLEAAKRDKIPPETMRQWFIEMIRRGWTNKMVQERYDNVLGSKMYGATSFSDWINSVEVYGMDEIKLIIKQKIDSMIERGRMLNASLNRNPELSNDDKKAIDLYAFTIVKSRIANNYYDAREKRKEEQIKFWEKKLGVSTIE